KLTARLRGRGRFIGERIDLAVIRVGEAERRVDLDLRGKRLRAGESAQLVQRRSFVEDTVRAADAGLGRGVPGQAQAGSEIVPVFTDAATRHALIADEEQPLRRQ